MTAPETARWLAVPVTPGSRVTVAGVAGGVGTTTVAALLARVLDGVGGCRLEDHGGGRVAAVAALPGVPPGGGPGGRAGRETGFVVRDAGPHALTPDADLLAHADAVVVVCRTDALGLAAAAGALDLLAAGRAGARERAVVAAVGRRAARDVLRDAADHGLGDVAVTVLRSRHDVSSGLRLRERTSADPDARALAALVVRALRRTSVGV